MSQIAVIVCVILGLTLCVECFPEKRVIKHLLDNYASIGKQGRPAGPTDTITVQFGLELINILYVDDQALAIHGWAKYNWTDPLLRWNPDDFDGVSKVRVSTKDIWTPDITLYNGLDTQISETPEKLALVTSDGNVTWIPMVTYTASCGRDKLDNIRECSLKFGSWVYDGYELDLQFYGGSEEIGMSYFAENNEWMVVENVGTKNVQYYECCEEPYPDITFTLKLQRLKNRRSDIY